MFTRYKGPALRAALAIATVASGCGAPGPEPRAASTSSTSVPPRIATAATTRETGRTDDLGATGSASAGLQVQLNTTKSGVCESVDLLGLGATERTAFAQLAPSQQAAVLSVSVVADAVDLPPIAGSRIVVGDALRFMPRFPLSRGLRYRVVLARGALGANARDDSSTVLEFSTPSAAATPATNVVQVYPTSDVLPENQLKFYVHFSAPMSRGDAYRHIHLREQGGAEVDMPFLELGEELWDPLQQRFTLLCDPGRIKRGVKPREDLGTVLTAGKTYVLSIEPRWRDAAGQPLGAEYTKTFIVAAADNTPIDLAQWRVIAPKAGTHAPCEVRFGEPLDHALSSRCLVVVNAAGEKIEGTAAIVDQETCFTFTPRVPWAAGEYKLVVDRAIEDLAGNAIGRAFDVDTFGPVTKQIEAESVTIPFVVEDSNGG